MKANKNIAILYDFLKELGGLERVMFFQANTLSKKHKANLFFIHIDDKKRADIEKKLSLNKNINSYEIIKGKSEIIKFISSIISPHKLSHINQDILICHSFMTSQMAHKKKVKQGTAYIIMLHHPPNFLYGRTIKWVNNLSRLFAYFLGLLAGPILRKRDIRAVRNADIVIVNSNYTKQRIKDIYGIEPVVIYPALGKGFVIISKNKAEKIISNLGIKNKFVLLHGRMIKDKRPDWAIRAFAKLAKRTNNIDLVISGTLEEKEKMKKLSNESGLKNRIIFLGKVTHEKLVALYNKASCFLMSAPKEDFGLTLIEAMACGCPVIAWDDKAGPNETIKDKETGFLAKPYDLDDFADKLQQALNKKWNKKQISLSVQKFSEKNISKQFLSLIDKLNYG